MKVYTKTGDKGMTSLYSGERIAKDSIRVEAYGTIDEFNSVLGMARAFCRNQDVVAAVLDLQKLLMKIMAEVASGGPDGLRLGEADVAAIEKVIDRFDARLEPLTEFLIPGANPGSAALDTARTVSRRAERQLWRLSREVPLNEQVLIALNRMSDLCFVLERAENELKG